KRGPSCLNFVASVVGWVAVFVPCLWIVVETCVVQPGGRVRTEITIGLGGRGKRAAPFKQKSNRIIAPWSVGRRAQTNRVYGFPVCPFCGGLVSLAWPCLPPLRKTVRDSG